MALTATEVEKVKPGQKVRRLADGNGLFLEVKPTGVKWWRYRYRKPATGKDTMLSLGKYPAVSLATARKKRLEAEELLQTGIDPADHKRMEKERRKQMAANTFQAVAEDWKAQYLSKKSPGHQKRTWSIIERCIFPYIGKKHIADVTAPDILAIARIHEKRGTIETAKRVIQTAGQIIRHGMATGACQIDPTPALRNQIQVPEKKHMPAPTDPIAVGDYLRSFDAFHGGVVVSVAIRLLPLLFCRPGELRKMRWVDVDLEAGEWRYTTSKTNTEHLVPLSSQAIELLEDIRPLTGHLPGGWVFIGGRSPLRPMSEAAINAAYRRLGIDTKTELTGHGWRSVARTLLHELLNYPPEVIEHQLAHKVPDALGRAYNRTRFIDQRKEMMQAWADYLDKLKAGAEVVAFPARQ
ncbi:tyrosine-type recombinase/integrase [Thiolapillus sp.]|uniref:tyrosine-type recombinase/integrase n=1 Tax=Thiolapillus sp. TaxID=2017437 RepID=UPI003AF8A12F